MSITAELTQRVLEANIQVHTRMATSYSHEEPHFRPENKAKVRVRLHSLLNGTSNARMLDLGCGTGFMIGIGSEFCAEIWGVDATAAMLEKVDLSGPTPVKLICGDTAQVELPAGYFDLVTSYSFLHHLCDVRPTLRNAARSLKTGGRLYVDLDPNFYFWDAICRLDEDKTYSPAIERELANTRHKDADVQARFGIEADTFNHAEYFKNVRGGFREEELEAMVLEEGFSHVQFFYHWFLGEALLLNEPGSDRATQLHTCASVTRALQEMLPVSRPMFKYLGFIATK